MAVDLGDLVESLQREVNPPGQDLYPTTSENDWVGYLADAFWEAQLNGMLKGWKVDGSFQIIPNDPAGEDIPRDLQQILVLYSGYRITITEFKNHQARFHGKAGPVEIEVEQASNVLKAILDALAQKIKLILTRVSDLGYGTEVEVMDAVIMHTAMIGAGAEWYVRG